MKPEPLRFPGFANPPTIRSASEATEQVLRWAAEQELAMVEASRLAGVSVQEVGRALRGCELDLYPLRDGLASGRFAIINGTAVLREPRSPTVAELRAISSSLYRPWYARAWRAVLRLFGRGGRP